MLGNWVTEPPWNSQRKALTVDVFWFKSDLYFDMWRIIILCDVS